MKFKTNDTVYLKAKVIRVESGDFEIGIGFQSNKYNLEILGAEDFIDTDEAPIYTKQEMLKELQKPELPKVGEVFFEYNDKEKDFLKATNFHFFFGLRSGIEMDNIINVCSCCGKTEEDMVHATYCIRCEALSYDATLEEEHLEEETEDED